MKKKLVALALSTVTDSSAMAVNGPIPFTWSNVPVNGVPTGIANIPGAILGGGELLVGVQVSFSGTVDGTVLFTPTTTTTATATLAGNHSLAFGSFNPVAVNAVSTSSPVILVPGGTAVNLSTGSSPIGGPPQPFPISRALSVAQFRYRFGSRAL